MSAKKIAFTKLAKTLPSSSVWSEPYAHRIVWVTMLAGADQEGFVDSSLPGLARLANVTLEECEAAIKCFQSPDPYSESLKHEGRRIKSEEFGGWTLLNYSRFRDERNG